MAVLVSRFPAETFSSQKDKTAENKERTAYISWPEALQYDSDFWLAGTDRPSVALSTPRFLLPPQLTSDDCKTWLSSRKHSRNKLEGWLSKDSVPSNAGARSGTGATKGNQGWLQPVICSEPKSVNSWAGLEKPVVVQSLNQWRSVGEAARPESNPSPAAQPNPWLLNPEKKVAESNPKKRISEVNPWLMSSETEQARKVQRFAEPNPWLISSEKKIPEPNPWLLLTKNISDPVEALRRGFQEFLLTPLGTGCNPSVMSCSGSSSSSSRAGSISSSRIQPSRSSDSVDYWMKKNENISFLCIEDDLTNWIAVDESSSEGSIVTLDPMENEDEEDDEDMVLVDGDLNQWLI